ncbi:hypothetical protein ACTNDN_01285 [Niallia sp. HCP3S3_B10]|uniref:hypothetical protein n=1 Tax=Niallia sp. HCP3S3_B10 TaxID=3438944 RepID=UPI003F8BF56F
MSILKSGKKVTTLLTLLVVLFSTITPFSNNYVSAKENTSYITMEKAEGELNISQKENISEEYGYDPQEKVRVIVELEEGPVLDYYSTKSKQEPSEFINSNKGKKFQIILWGNKTP